MHLHDSLERAAGEKLHLHADAERIGGKQIRAIGRPAAVAEPDALYGGEVFWRDAELLLDLIPLPAVFEGFLFLIVVEQCPLIGERLAIWDADSREAVGDLDPAVLFVFDDRDESAAGGVPAVSFQVSVSRGPMSVRRRIDFPSNAT
jgi:hypothetical protein